MRALPAVLLACVALAGCSGGGSEASVADAPGAPVAPPGDGLGAVSGVVVDAAIRPVAGAVIRLSAGPLQAEATSDEGGLFAFPDVPPGLAIVEAARTGFLPGQRVVQVDEGDVADVRITLKDDPRPTPYPLTLQKDGYMEAWTGYAQYYVESAVPNGTALCDCRIEFVPGPNATAFVLEAYWTATTPHPVDDAFYWVVDDTEGDGHAAGYCTSPCIQVVDFEDEGFVPGNLVYARLDGPDFSAVAQQEFQLFVTTWYHGAPPPGWSVGG